MPSFFAALVEIVGKHWVTRPGVLAKNIQEKKLPPWWIPGGQIVFTSGVLQVGSR